MSELDCKSATFGEVKLTCANFDSDWGACGSCQSCKSRLLIASYQARIEELEAALRFYADEGNWKRRGNLPVAWHDSLVSIDGGDNARQALQENTDVG